MSENAPYTPMTIEFRNRQCLLKKGTYCLGGGTALRLVDASSGKEIVRLTENVPFIESDEVAIRDYGETDGMLEVLENAGVVKRTGAYLSLDKVELPICKFLAPDKKYEHDRQRSSGHLGQVPRRTPERER